MLVWVDPNLVQIAQGLGADWSGSSSCRREIAVGCYFTAFLIGGFLGLGAAWLYTGARTPRPGERIKVVKNDGSSRTGPWGGLGHHGDFKVGKSWYDPNDLAIVGPEIHNKRGKPFIDLTYGWVDPKILAKLTRAHNRDGYRKRKGRKRL